MTTAFIYPCDPFNSKKVDESFLEEYELIQSKGFKCFLINMDGLDNSKLFPSNLLNEQDSLIYRGWMLTEENYEKLNNKLNYQLKTNTENYLKAHHLPNWYNDLKEYTMKSEYSPLLGIKKLYDAWGDKPAFVKDYVKSLKTSQSPIVNSEKELDEVIEKMLKFRGHIEGGIVLREVKDLNTSTESRFFVLGGQVFSKAEYLQPEMLKMAEEIAQKTNLFFFSIDIAKDNDNKLWLIEIGDGQVSDSVGWEAKKFVNIFEKLKIKNTFKP